VPADRKLYALRDVTATVPSIPLITASIMSKKLAEGIDALVLDVKFGPGAFMSDLARARELAESLVRVGRAMGKRVSALLTDMSQPLGRAAGNALEVAECLDVLRGQGPEDTTELTLALAEEMLRLCGQDVPRARLAEALGGGEARRRFEDMVRRHGGDPAAPLPQARLRREVPAGAAGFVAAADAGAIGRVCLLLGAGRARTTDRVDPAVGASGIAKIGERVEGGQPLMVLHANDERKLEEAWTLAKTAHRLSASPPVRPPLIREAQRSPPPGPA
jgi:pyrimidine-nucleoside phosphorylase